MRRCWPSARIPTTSNSAAAASSRWRPRRPAGAPGRLLAGRVGHARHARERTLEAERAARAARRDARVHRARRRRPPGSQGRARDPPGRRDPAACGRPSSWRRRLVENQHPDHYRLGRLVRDAARLARYGGARRAARAAAARDRSALLLRAVARVRTPRRDARPVDVSAPEVVAAWTAAMEAHASQVQARNYVELQLTRARSERPAGRRSATRSPSTPTTRPSSTRWRSSAATRAASDMALDRPLRIGITCYPSVGGSGILASALGEDLAPPRARRAFHQLRAPVPAAGRRARDPLPSGGDQRLRPVQVPRLHAAPLGEDGRGEPRASARRAARPLRRAACDGGHPGAVDAAARAAAPGRHHAARHRHHPAGPRRRATGRRSATPWSCSDAVTAVSEYLQRRDPRPARLRPADRRDPQLLRAATAAPDARRGAPRARRDATRSWCCTAPTSAR